MLAMIDTSAWIAAFRDRTGAVRTEITKARGDMNEVFSRFVAMEILRGSNSEADWARYEDYLAGQTYVDFEKDDWAASARLYVDCRRAGHTVRSTIDCCIAHQAIRHDLLLIHNDKDYEHIARVAPLRQVRLKISRQKAQRR